MKNRFVLQMAVMLWTLGSGSQFLQAQQQVPDYILYNGKVVTLSDQGVNEIVGPIVQALAVTGNSIVATGTDAQVRALAGPNTKSVDLKGRMVIPGFGATHDHPDQWNPLNPLIQKKVLNDSIHVERTLNVSPDQTLQQFPRVLEEAVGKAKPGQWIRINMLYGDEYQWSDEIGGFIGRQINKEMVDMIAPNNPLIVRGGMTGMLLNQKGLDETRAHYGDEWAKFDPGTNPWTVSGGAKGEEEKVWRTGVSGTGYRYPEQDVLYKGKTDVLAEIYRLGLSWMTGYGQTLNVTNIYTAGAMAAYSSLDQKGQLPMRFPWVWYWPPRKDFFLDQYFVNALVAMIDQGSDYFWLTAINAATNLRACTSLPGTSPEVKARERQQQCALDPNDPDYGQKNRQMIYNVIKAGGRFGGAHTSGDQDQAYLLDIIEQASKDAGMTIEQIRAKRHAYDHIPMLNTALIPRLKNLGMMVGGYDIRIYTSGAADRLKDYGEQAVDWMFPRKSLLDAGVRSSVEIDMPIDYTNITYFYVLYSAITRKDRNGQVWGPRQAVSREAILKSATQGAAYYTKRETKLGSLEAGKWADFSVLDRDYLTIPVDDILNIRVMMTMVGGKIQHLVPSVAREWGLPPAGAQVELGGKAAQY
ncbi:MAG: hypothetical protein A3F68_09990 [Acidobacteria bacterium RIFCSPLOWO2_12_FULL_54_10]|nr:MAG: hypothetical protein A3F68_09990 [Acidobacteria bacterium RIFCSPLOWO2_12_FULL_54_10]